MFVQICSQIFSYSVLYVSYWSFLYFPLFLFFNVWAFIYGILYRHVIQAPLSMGFSRQEYWSGLPFPSPENRPNIGIEPWSPALQADSLPTVL